MANVVKLKRSAVASKVPTTSDLELGELAINTYDGKLFIKKDNGSASIVEIGAGGSASISVSATAPSSPTANQLWWNSESGILFIYFNDGNTSQWVQVLGGSGLAGSSSSGGTDQAAVLKIASLRL